MKPISFIISFSAIVLCIQNVVFAQTVIGPLTNNAREYIWQSGSSGLLGTNVSMYLGKPTNQAYRDFFQWDLPDNVIPDGAHITQVKLEFSASPQGGSPQLGAGMYKIDYDLTGSTSWTTLYAAAENPDNFLGQGSATNGTFSATFTEGDFTEAVEAGLANNRFALAVRSSYEILWNYWHYVGSGSAELTIWVAKDTVIADQVFETTNRVEGSAVGRWEQSAFVPYSVPHQFEFDLNSTQTMRADTNLWTNPQTSLLEKYRTWNGLDNVINHKDFLIRPPLQNVTSQFKKANDATVQAYLVDLGTYGGTIEFADPWLRDNSDEKGKLNRGSNAILHSLAFGQYNIGLNSEYKGVFLNQPMTSGNAYYSVNADYEQTINGITWQFAKWVATTGSASFQNAFAQYTGVMFTESGTTVSALYKVPYHSSHVNTSTTNSQRNLAGGGTLIYESGGDIWQAGSPDVLLSDGSGASSAPSVTDGIYVVWREMMSNGNWNLYFRHNYGSWAPAQVVSQVSGSADPHPVIANAAWAGTAVVLWEGSGGLMYAEGSSPFTSWSTYSVSGARPYNPSITTGNGSSSWLFFSCDDGGDISLGVYLGYAVGDTMRVPASIAPLSYSSQISGDGSGVWFHVVWDAFDQDVVNQTIWYQSYNDVDWTAAHEFVDANARSYSHPTVSHLSAGDAYVAWDDGSNSYSAYVPVDDPTIYTYTSTIGPNFEQGSTLFVTTSTSGPPFALQFHNAMSASPSRMNAVSQTYSRRVVAARERGKNAKVDSSSHFSVELSGITLKLTDGSLVPLSFSRLKDEHMNEANAWGRLATTTFALPESIDSVLVEGAVGIKSLNWIRGEGENGMKLSFDLLDAQTGQLIQKIGSEKLYTENGKRGLSVRGKLAQVGSSTREVYISASVKGIAPKRKDIKYTLVHVHTLDTGSSGTGPKLAAKTQSQSASLLPTKFALHQNYPNPFNPSTQFNFDLPEAANVSLVVYDVLGRQVVELANGLFEAGYHAATWNVPQGGTASGVYFARFTATKPSGEVAYSRINKLILMK
jgi:hypothetical protein